MKIVADSHIPFINDYFGGYGQLILKSGRSLSHADVKDADILLVRSITPVNEALLAESCVKFVGSVTAGSDHLDTKWLDEAGILWRVAKGFNSPPVADYVVSVLAALQQEKILPEKKVRAAVIGVGSAGQLVVDKMRLLNMDVTVCDPLRAQSEPDFISTPLHDIHDMDIISLHVPLTKSGPHATYHFIDKHFLQKQISDCVLINASRGAVIDSNDLMQYGSHLHWCFDVWEHEPNIDKKIMERAIIATPHIAGYSVQSKIRGIDIIYKMACDTALIKAKPITPIVMPIQTLAFSGHRSWQEIVLGVFNPMILTHRMREGCGFDEMRNQFNYRYELAYTMIKEAKVSGGDAALLRKLGVK